MKLNNKTNGKTVAITKTNCELNQIIYQMFEFGNYNPSEPQSHKFATNIKDLFDTQCIVNEEIYKMLQADIFPDFVVEKDSQNWLFLKRPIRVYIPDTITAKSVNNKDSLAYLIESIRLSIPIDFRIATETGVVAYLEELYPEHRSILEQYPDIIIENK